MQSDKKYQTVVVGGGIAGMHTASNMHKLGVKTLLIEKNDRLGGHLNQYYKVFPNFKDAHIIIGELCKNIENLKVPYLIKTEVQSVTSALDNYIVHLSTNETIETESIVFANGFNTFEASKKEEYGYGIYPNVITSVELEEQLKVQPEESPNRIAFVHCVGSRDEKTNNFHCSKVCCVTAVKQAIELKERYPQTEIICLYMDLRMYDNGFEELYREAQIKHNIQFIRGRLSEASLNIDKKITLKIQDTLAGVPMRLTVDKLVLMVGKTPSNLPHFSSDISVNLASHGFIQPVDVHLKSNQTSQAGIFCCGTSSGPKTIQETMSDAVSASISVYDYINKK